MSRYFELARVLHDVGQRTAEKRDLAVEALRLIDDLLNARHVRGERRDDDASGRAREDVRERLADDALRERVSGAFGIGRIGEHAQHAGVADARDRREVGRIAVDRRLIELEIAGVKERAERRADRERARARERMIDVNELGRESRRSVTVSPGSTFTSRGRRACVRLSFALISASVSGVPTIGHFGNSRKKYGMPPM